MTEISTAGYHLILKLLNMYLVAYFQKNFEDEGNPIGKTIQAALDQSHKSGQHQLLSEEEVGSHVRGARQGGHCQHWASQVQKVQRLSLGPDLQRMSR